MPYPLLASQVVVPKDSISLNARDAFSVSSSSLADPCAFDGRKDTAALGKDIEIGDTMEFHTKLILSPTAKNQVGMCVHKARRDQSSLCIYPFSIYVGRGASPNLKNPFAF